MNSNVTITDWKGRELIRIEDYALVAMQGKPDAAAVDGNEKENGKNIPRAVAGNRPETIGMPDELDRESGEEQKNLLKHGILNSEGIEVFKRVLGVTAPQLAVSTMDLEKRMLETQPLDAPPTMETLEAMMKQSKPKYSRPELNIPYVAPRNEMEKILAETWQTFLGIDRVGVHDNFFELGANSLGIIQVSGILKELLKKELTVVTMYAYPTVEQLAAYLGAGEGEDEAALKKEIVKMETASPGRNKLRQRKRKVTGGDHV